MANAAREMKSQEVKGDGEEDAENYRSLRKRRERGKRRNARRKEARMMKEGRKRNKREKYSEVFKRKAKAVSNGEVAGAGEEGKYLRQSTWAREGEKEREPKVMELIVKFTNSRAAVSLVGEREENGKNGDEAKCRSNTGRDEWQGDVMAAQEGKF